MRHYFVNVAYLDLAWLSACVLNLFWSVEIPTGFLPLFLLSECSPWGMPEMWPPKRKPEHRILNWVGEQLARGSNVAPFDSHILSPLCLEYPDCGLSPLYGVCFSLKCGGFSSAYILHSQSLKLNWLKISSKTVLYYLLTPRSRVLHEKLISSQVVKKFPAFYGTRIFITAFTSARHLFLSWASSIQSMPPHPTS